jgi:hypothetical protein
MSWPWSLPHSIHQYGYVSSQCRFSTPWSRGVDVVVVFVEVVVIGG